MAKCKECQAEIQWIEMQYGNMMPCEEKKTWLVIVRPNGKGKLTLGYEPHWENCPAAKFFKGRG